jgi:DivIVA domain-containing protein
MGQYVLLLVVALTVGAVVFGVTVLVSGGDPGLSPVEPDGRAVPLPGTRPLAEPDIAALRFDTALRGYRMAQVDRALRRAAYDIGYKDELISVLRAEVEALREGRHDDAEVLRQAREAALAPAGPDSPVASPAAPAAEPAAGSDPVDPPVPVDAAPPAADPGAADKVVVGTAAPTAAAAGAPPAAGGPAPVDAPAPLRDTPGDSSGGTSGDASGAVAGDAAARPADASAADRR